MNSTIPSGCDVYIVIPFIDFKKLSNCLDSIYDSEQEAHLVLIGDSVNTKSEAYEIFKNKFKRKKNLSLVINNTRLGFTESVNKALKLIQTGDIVIMHSDVVVPKLPWLDELKRAAKKNKSVGFSAPVFTQGWFQGLPGTQNISNEEFFVASDNIYKAEHSDMSIDYALSICLYINRVALKKVKRLNKTYFNYGAILDWCMHLRDMKGILVRRVLMKHTPSSLLTPEGSAKRDKDMALLKKRWQTRIDEFKIAYRTIAQNVNAIADSADRPHLFKRMKVTELEDARKYYTVIDRFEMVSGKKFPFEIVGLS